MVTFALAVAATASCGGRIAIEVAAIETMDATTSGDAGIVDATVVDDGAVAEDALDATPHDGAERCRATGLSCSANGECCPGLQCQFGVCTCACCKPDFEVCATNAECCSGICNSRSHVCGLEVTCRTTGWPCDAASECCTDYCANGLCSAAPLDAGAD